MVSDYEDNDNNLKDLPKIVNVKNPTTVGGENKDILEKGKKKDNPNPKEKTVDLLEDNN